MAMSPLRNGIKVWDKTEGKAYHADGYRIGMDTFAFIMNIGNDNELTEEDCDVVVEVESLRTFVYRADHRIVVADQFNITHRTSWWIPS